MNDGGRSPAGAAPRSLDRRLEERLSRRGGLIECLRAPAWAFGVAAGLRSGLYESGLWMAHRMAVPVFSVGNLSVGGTGKTPMVIWLARELERRGRRVGWLARGYGARKGLNNDEVRMLERALPNVAYVQGRDRVLGAQQLVMRGIDAIVLDDGFQHRRLARDVDIVLIDATRPWGTARDAAGSSVRALLPRGLLRESPRALQRADVIVITRVDQVPAEWLEELAGELETLAPGVPQVRCVHAGKALQANDGTRQPLEFLRGRKVDLVSGIGNPAAFAESVRALGARLNEERRFKDHHDYTAADVAGLGGAGHPLVCTAKDQVKLAALGIPCLALEIELELQSGRSTLEALIDSALHAAVGAIPQGRVP